MSSSPVGAKIRSERLKLTIAYDGAHFAGWQSQAHGQGVQDFIEKAFLKITGKRVVVNGAGRTDAGVHALAQCAHVDVTSGFLTPMAWRKALNACLPATVRILRSVRVAPDFHARFSATGKIYRYRIRTAAILPPHELGRVWHLPQLEDYEVLVSVAKSFQGRHDFSAYSANRGGNVRDARRTIRRVEVFRHGSLVTLTFEGEGFLYKMIRMMVGAAGRAARGKADAEDLLQRLNAGGPRWNRVAPPDGLYLTRVLYRGDG